VQFRGEITHLWIIAGLTFITVLHGIQMRSSDENSIRLSVCPLSNVCIVTKRKKKLSGFLYCAKDRLA